MTGAHHQIIYNPMSDAHKETIPGRVTRELAEQIIRGDLRPGERLRQNDIAEAFETSHVPVREAFLRLEGLGLAISRPRRGFVVTEVDPAEASQIVDMRKALETLALRQAVPHFRPLELREATELADRCNDARTFTEWESANRAFHRALVTPCGNKRLLKILDELMLTSARLIFLNRQKYWRPRVDQDHAHILNAIARKNADLAAAVLSRHIGRAR